MQESVRFKTKEANINIIDYKITVGTTKRLTLKPIALKTDIAGKSKITIK